MFKTNYTVKLDMMIHQKYLYYGKCLPTQLGWLLVSVINRKCTQEFHKVMVTCIDNYNKVKECQAIV